MALLYPILDKVRQYLEPKVPGDVLIGVVPEVVDTSGAGVIVGILGSVSFSDGQAHGQWATTSSGVTQVVSVDITLEVYVAFGNNVAADAIRQADNVAEVIRTALEGRLIDDKPGPLELRNYFTPREPRGTGFIFEQTWSCYRMAQ